MWCLHFWVPLQPAGGERQPDSTSECWGRSEEPGLPQRLCHSLQQGDWDQQQLPASTGARSNPSCVSEDKRCRGRAWGRSRQSWAQLSPMQPAEPPGSAGGGKGQNPQRDPEVTTAESPPAAP